MEIPHQLTEQDFVEAYSAHRGRRPILKWGYRIFFWMVVGLAAVILLAFLVQPTTHIRWIEGKNQILPYTSPACFNILPIRALMPEQVADLRGMLKQYISSKAY